MAAVPVPVPVPFGVADVAENVDGVSDGEVCCVLVQKD